MQEQGIVYVLTNPCMPGLVKIGMTERNEMDSRLKELNSATGVPVAFDCVYACKVNRSECRRIEKALHTAFAPQRINVNREFFQIQPEQAIAILALFHHEDVTSEVTAEIENDLTPEDKAAKQKMRTMRPALHFLDMGLPKGTLLVYKDDEAITCSVVDQKHVLFDGQITTLTPITTKILGKSYAVQPTPYWIVKETGKNLLDIYNEKYPMEDSDE